MRGHFLSKAEEARRLDALRAELHAEVAAKRQAPMDPEPCPLEEPMLEQLKRLFKAADRPTKRAYLRWLQDYLTYIDQVLEPEEWEHA